MTQDTPSWAVVATVDEPPGVVQAFVAWYLSLGAAEVHLYFDRPDAADIPGFDKLPQVRVSLCDERHWKSVGKSRPRRHQVRQVANARQAYAQTDCDWLLHADADEFVWAEVPVAEVLAQVDTATEGLTLPAAERIHLGTPSTATCLTGPFRRPFMGSVAEGRALFDPDYRLTNRGLTGHTQGKAFVRTKADLRMSIHRPKRADGSDSALERADPTALELLHFDGLTPQYWVYKLMRMAYRLVHQNGMPPSKHRRAQADALLAAPEGALALYERLKRFDGAGEARLQQAGLLATPEFDPGNALRRYFPGEAVDLTPGAVDLWLRHNKSDIIAFLQSE